MERQRELDLLQRGGDHPFALGADGADLGPAGGDVGDGQRPAEETVVVAAVGADQVALDEAGPE